VSGGQGDGAGADAPGGGQPGERQAGGYEALDDAALLAALRRDEARAYSEFVRRHHRLLLHQARRARLGGDDADALVVEVLEETLTRLTGTGAPPRDLRLYMAKVFHRRFLNRVRDELRRARVVREAAQPADAADPGEGPVVASACSEGTLRDAGRMAGEAPRASEVVAALAAALDDAMSDEERTLLGWMSEHVPQRTIAEWLGASQNTVRQRVYRLRHRLRGIVAARGAAAGAAERDQLEALLRRAGVDARTAGARRRPSRARAHRAERAEEGR
jgi:RNA polymerase sigma factor (sigma-70 family)